MVSNEKQFEERIISIQLCGKCKAQIQSSGLCSPGCFYDGGFIRWMGPGVIKRKIYQIDLFIEEVIEGPYA